MGSYKRIIKCAVFFLIILLLILFAQEILREKFEHEYDFLEARYESMIAQSHAGMDIDVLYCGSSPVYAGIAPIIMWKDHGYTGMNLGTNTQNAMSMYYSLLYALEYCTPKVVVLDFSGLNEDRLPVAGTNHSATALKTLYVIQSPKIRFQFMTDIAKATKSLDIFFPIAEFHERWDGLTALDFGEITYVYEEYAKGSWLSRGCEVFEYQDSYNADYEAAEVSQFTSSYYERIIALCKENNIALIGISLPQAKFEYRLGLYAAIEDFCTIHKIPYYNYNEPVLLKESNVLAETDYMNSGHLNARGAIKVSHSFGNKLKELFELPDHRNDSAYSSWNEEMKLFHEDYGDIINQCEQDKKKVI